MRISTNAFGWTRAAMVLGLTTLSAAGAATGAAPPQPTLFVSPLGVDNPRCARAAPCLRFAHAHAIAKLGAIIEVAAGDYVEQTIELKASGAGPRIVFQPARGARVSVAGVTVKGSQVEFRDITIRSWLTKSTADNVHFVNVTNGGFWIEGSSNVSIIRGSVGPGVDYHPTIAPDGAQQPRNIVVDRVFFHDWTRTNGDVHTECLQVGGADGLVIRRSRFWNCSVMALFLSYWGGGPHPRNITIENNFFDQGGDGGFYSVRFADHAPAWENVLVRYNSALAPINVDMKPQLVNFRIVANVAPLEPWGCNDRIQYRYNVWSDARCASTDVRAPAGFRDPARLDLRLKTNARAINRGDPKNFPRYDNHGERRPKGKRADAGADEAR